MASQDAAAAAQRSWGWVLRILGALLLLTSLALALTRAPDLPVESLVGRYAPPPSDFVEVRGQVVHLRDEGPRDDPEPIVLIHGTGASLHTWEGWVRALKPARRVITFDLPGFGLTGPFDGAYAPDDYRGETYARFVIDLLNHLRVERAVLGGNSLGGEVAWRTAVLAPVRVARLILVDPAGADFVPQSLPLGFVVARTPGLNRLAEWMLPREVVEGSVENVYGDPARVTPELVERYYQLTLREGNRRALRIRMEQLEPGAGIEGLKTIRAPTLILWGGRDRWIPPSVARVFTESIEGSRGVEFPGLGHVPHEEDPAATVGAVREFLGLPPR
ncbi:MAG: alpha/beta fold hydrolase [Pseudomonadota bacterium]